MRVNEREMASTVLYVILREMLIYCSYNEFFERSVLLQ